MNLLKMSPRSASMAAATLSLGLLAMQLGGCNKPVDDATLNSNVQAAITGDSHTNNEPVTVTTHMGVVTLTGNVTDDTVLTAAAQDAAGVKGVKEVVNDLTIAGVSVAPTITTPSAPTSPRPTTPQERQAIANNQPLPPPAENSAPPAPVAPPSRDVTLAAGAVIPVRIDQTLDSATTQTGQSFTGTVTHEVVTDGMVAIPAGAAVSGTVALAKDATHFKGSSELSIQITSIRRHGSQIPVATDAYTVAGKGRGENTAEKVGGGAAVGAILGGIFGGGKGAAIGAAAGGGGGAVWQGTTRGQQVSIPAETIVHFHLAQSITVRTSETPSGYEPVTLRNR